MATTIALAGKGGVGKTTIAGLIVKYLVMNKLTPVLAIDADPSSNFNFVLGVELESTVGDIREDMLDQVKETVISGGAIMGSLPGGITKRDFLDYHIRSALVEGDDFDLIAMGRSEGPGCYCAVNHNLRLIIDAISKNYRFIVIDNEAGMEHLSRRTTRDVDHLLIVTDPTLRGLMAAERIAQFRNELDIKIKNAYLIINRLKGDLNENLYNYLEKINLPVIGKFKDEDLISEFDANGKPLIKITEDSSLYKEVNHVMQELGISKQAA